MYEVSTLQLTEYEYLCAVLGCDVMSCAVFGDGHLLRTKEQGPLLSRSFFHWKVPRQK